MPAPLIPSPLDRIGRSQFAFRPPIKNADPNEWTLAAMTLSEIKIVNTRTGRVIWMPRHYIDAVSCGGALMIVGITKQLEYRGGTLRPSVKGVIEMPFAADDVEARRSRIGTALGTGAGNWHPGRG